MTERPPIPELAAQEEPHFLDDPDVSDAFARMLEEFSRETDRGAVLVAADIVSAHLGRSLEDLAPEPFRPKRIKELLKYPGVLSNFAARADVAFMAGYINETAHRSIDLLRKLRNKAAHSQDAFSLHTERKALRALCDLGPGTATAVNRFAFEAMMKTFIDSVMDTGVGLEAKIGHNPFASPGAVIDYLGSRPDITAVLEERLPRTELAFGVWLLLGLVSHERKSLLSKNVATKSKVRP